MKWVVRRKRTVLVSLDSSHVTTDNASIINLYATKLLIVRMNQTNHFIVTSMNVPRSKSINVDINALIHSLVITAIVIKDTSKFWFPIESEMFHPNR